MARLAQPDELFPTSARIIGKMLDGIKLDPMATVLEPNAGKGDIANAVIAKYEEQKYRYDKSEHSEGEDE